MAVDRAEPKQSKLAVRLAQLTAMPFAALGILALFGSQLDSTFLKSFADRLSSDGQAERFPLEAFGQIQRRLLLFGASWIVYSLVHLLAGGYLARLFVSAIRDDRGPQRRLPGWIARHIQQSPRHALAVCLLTALFASLTASQLDQPLRCDEALTAMEYVAKPWYYPAVVYDSPNNHVLHSLLAHWSSRLTGGTEWGLRLPAFLAGLLFVPLAYAAARKHFGKEAGLIAAALFAASPYAVEVATNARGYSQALALTLMLLLLAPRLVRGAGTAWLLFAAVAVLGMYSVPAMMMPLAAIMLWIFLSGLLVHRGPARLGFIARILAAGLLMVAGTAALYTPAFIAIPVDNVVGRVFHTESSASGLLDTMAAELRFSWHNWAGSQLGMMIGLALAVLALLASIFHRPVPHVGWWLVPAAAAGVLIMHLLFRRPVPHWALSIMMPFHHLFLASLVAGLFGSLRASAHDRVRCAWCTAAAGLALAAGLATLAHQPHPQFRRWYIGYHDARDVERWFHQQGASAPFVIGTFTTPSLVYYAWARGYTLPTLIIQPPLPDRPDAEPLPGSVTVDAIPADTLHIVENDTPNREREAFERWLLEQLPRAGFVRQPAPQQFNTSRVWTWTRTRLANPTPDATPTPPPTPSRP